MRKLEEEMVSAIVNRYTWHGTNTTVKIEYNSEHDFNEAFVYLWGNLIAKVNNCGVWMSSAGWSTTTTRSRLSAIAEACYVNGRVTTLGGYMHIASGKDELYDLSGDKLVKVA